MSFGIDQHVRYSWHGQPERGRIVRIDHDRQRLLIRTEARSSASCWPTTRWVAFDLIQLPAETTKSQQ